MRCSNKSDARFMWERWPNFHFIAMPGNLFFFQSTHSFLLVLLTENILKTLKFCCKEPDTKQQEKNNSSSYPYNGSNRPLLMYLQ